MDLGQRLGSYEVVSKLGEGGMGAVYRALDTRLNRAVALKVLSDDLADAAARRRFQREAEAASSLNHPHILTVFDAGETDNRQYLVTELVDGGTLRDWLKKPHDWREAVELLIGVADALASAHEAGILHRDIKPENILITKSGYAKLADFGLAKLQEQPVADDAVTVVDMRTRAGVVLGTSAYMSPEQVVGRGLDGRSDEFSFGIVLSEALAGHRPFQGASQPDVLDAILRAAPEPLPSSVPAPLRALVEKTLEKDPAFRFQSMREVVVELRRMLRQSGEQPAKSAARPAPDPRRRTAMMALTAVLFVAGATAAVFLWSDRSSRAVTNVQYTQLTNFADSAVQPALSPDGKMLAFVRGEDGKFFSDGQVYVKLLPEGQPVQLSRDSSLKMSPKFSPDGTRIAYSTGIRDATASLDTWVVPVLGGQPQKLLTNGEGLTWVPNGTDAPRILFSELVGTGGQMSVVTSTESRAEQRTVYMPRSVNGMAHKSYLSPDGKWVLAAEMEAAWLPCRLVPFDGSSPGKPVGPAPAQCTDAAWTPDGKWMYFSTNTGGGTHIWRQRFPDGMPEQVTFGVTEEDGIHFAPDGRSFVTSIGTSQSTVWVHDGAGTRQITSEGYGFRPSISPDGKKAYYLVRGETTGSFIAGGLWIVDLASGQKQRLLPDFQIRHYAISADGQRVAFMDGSASGGVWIAPLNAQTPPRRLGTNIGWTVFFGEPGEVVFAGDENGALITYRIGEDGSGLRKILALPNLFAVGVSPDGKWIAAQDSRQWGALKLFPRDQGEPILLCAACSPPPGTAPMPADAGWTPDGKFMYLHIDNATLAIPLASGNSLPSIPAGGFASKDAVMKVRGARVVTEEPFVFTGPNPSVYAFTRITTQRNIYRVPVP